MQNEPNENDLTPEQPANVTVDQQEHNEDTEELQPASTRPLPSSPPPRPPSSPPTRSQSPPPRASVSDLPSSPRPPPPKPPLPSSPKTTSSENSTPSPPKVIPLPPAGRPSLLFGPPPSRPSTSTTAPVPAVDIRSLWMGSANLAEEREEEGEGDEGEQEPEEEEEDGDDGPVDRQGRPIRSTADVKKKRGGGGPSVTEQPTLAPFSFAPLETLSFASGTNEKPKVSPAKSQQDHEGEIKTSSFMDALQGLSGFSFGSSTDPFSFSNSVSGVNSATDTAEVSGDPSKQLGTKDSNDKSANEAPTTTASNTSTEATTTSVPQKAQAPPPPPFSGGLGLSESKYQESDDDEKSGPVDRNGRPTRAATDIKKKRTPGGGREAPAAESDPASTLPFIFAPMHLRSPESGFSAGSSSDNSNNSGSGLGGNNKKTSRKGKSPLTTNKGVSVASSFPATESSESTSFSDLAASLGSFSFTTTTTSSDVISPFAFGGTKIDGPVFGEQKIPDLSASTSSTSIIAPNTSFSTFTPSTVTLPTVASPDNIANSTFSSTTTNNDTNGVFDGSANGHAPQTDRSETDPKLGNDTGAQKPNLDIETPGNEAPPEAATSPRRPPPPIPRPTSPPPPPTSPRLLVANLPPPRKPPVLALTQPSADIRELWMGSKPDDAEENTASEVTETIAPGSAETEPIAPPLESEATTVEVQGEARPAPNEGASVADT